MSINTRFFSDLKSLNPRPDNVELSKELEYAESTVSEYLSGKKQMSNAFIKKFYEKYFPEKAAKWESETDFKKFILAEPASTYSIKPNSSKITTESILEVLVSQASSLDRLATTLQNQAELLKSQQEIIKELISGRGNSNNQIAASM